jgi:hypothetical protein
MTEILSTLTPGDILTIGIIAGIIGGQAIKNVLLIVYPPCAKVFAFIDRGQMQLSEVITAADTQLNKNQDLRDWALRKGFKIAANLIKE